MDKQMVAFYFFLLIITAITVLAFIGITDQAEECRDSGGEYINTNNGGECFKKKN